MKTATQAAIALDFRALSYRYPSARDWALKDVSFSLRRGEFLAVLGPNGAGKSSLCRCANGIIPHSEGGYLKGRVFAFGADTRTRPVFELARRVGLVLDDPDAQLFATTVLDEVAFGPENLGMEAGAIRADARRLLDAVGLSGLEKRSPATLSGGQKQRLAVAAALAMSPGLLVLDEPTAALDGEGAEALMSLVAEMKERLGLAVLMATHDTDLVSRYADTALILEKGCAVAHDSVARLLAVPPAEEAPAPYLELRSAPRPPCGDDEPVLSFENVSSEYPGGIAALRGVCFRARRGEFVGIVGRNGSGKTTLLKCLVGLVRPSAGSVRIGSRPVDSLSPAELASRVAYVQQNPDLQLFEDSVGKEAAFGPTNLGFPAAEVERRVAGALERVGLSAKRAEHPLGLNRADRSLTALASVLAMESGIVLLDEPTRGQDLPGSMKVMEIARSLCAEGRTVVAVGHDRAFLSRYADRIVVMDDGRLAADPIPGCRDEAGRTIEAVPQEESLCV